MSGEIEASSSSEDESRSVSLNIPQKVWESLENISREELITRPEALRRAVSIYKFVHDKVQEGGSIFVQYSDGKTEKIVFPWTDTQIS